MFRDQYPDMQHIVRELMLLREHNMKIGEALKAVSTVARAEGERRILLFAEGAMVLVALERFLRIILGVNANAQTTLPNLLDQALSPKRGLLRTPPEWDLPLVKRQITDVRNTILHGNYEQAAAQAGTASVREYFKSQYTGEVERLFKVFEFFLNQIDVRTGRPVNG